MSVSLPATISVGEDEGIVEICATMSAMEDTQRNLTIILATENDTGMNCRMHNNEYNVFLQQLFLITRLYILLRHLLLDPLTMPPDV